MDLSRSVLLSDSTNITFSKSRLDLGLNSYSGSLNLENETILSQNSNISISKVLNSKSFLERVKSIQSNESNSSGIFCLGALKQIKLKKKEKKNDSMSDCSITLSKDKEKENLNQSFGNKNKTSISFNVDESESLTVTLGQTANGNKSNLVKNGRNRNPNVERVSVHFQCDSVDSSSTYNESSLLPKSTEATSENVGRVLRRSRRNNVSVNFSGVSDFSSDIHESRKSGFNESSNLSNDVKNSSSQKFSRKRKYVRDQNVSVQLQEDPSSSGNSLELELESKEILSKESNGLEEDSEKLSLNPCKDTDNRCTGLNKDTVEKGSSRKTRSQNIKKNSTKPKQNKNNVSVDFNLSNSVIKSSTSVSELASVEQKVEEVTLNKNIDDVKTLACLSSDICELNISHNKPTTETDVCGIPCVKNTEQCIPNNFDFDKDTNELATSSTGFTGNECSEEAVREPCTFSDIDNSETLNSKKFAEIEPKNCDKNVSVQLSITMDTFHTFANDNKEENEKITIDKRNCETSIQISLPPQESGAPQCQEHTGESGNQDIRQIVKNPVSVRLSSDMDTPQLSANGPDFTKTSNELENAAQSKDLDPMQNSLENTHHQSKNFITRDECEVSGNCENMLVPNTVLDKECDPLIKETQKEGKDNINATFIIENHNMGQTVDNHSVKMISKELESKNSPPNNNQVAVECSNINTTYTISKKKSKIPVFKGTKNKKETVNKELQNRNEVIVQEMDINDVRFSEDQCSVDNLRCQPCDSELIELQNMSMEPVDNPKISLQSDLGLNSFDSQISDIQQNSLEIFPSLSLTNVISNPCKTKSENNEMGINTNGREMNGMLLQRVSSTSETPSEIILHQHASLHVNGIENVVLSCGMEDLPDSTMESKTPEVPKITVVNEDISRKDTSFQSGPISAINKSNEIQDQLKDSSASKIISELPIISSANTDQKRYIIGNISDTITVPKINKDISHSDGDNVETILPGSEETSSDCSSNEKVTQESPNCPEIQTILPTTSSSGKPQDIVEHSIQQRDLSITNCSNSRTSKDSKKTTPSSSVSGLSDISKRIDSKSPVQNTAANTTAEKYKLDKIPVSDCEKNASPAKNAIKMACPDSEMSSNCSSSNRLQGFHPSDIENILPPTTLSGDKRQEIVEPNTQQKALSTTNDGVSDNTQIIEGKKTKDISERKKCESVIPKCQPTWENISHHIPVPNNENVLSYSTSHGISDSNVPPTITQSVSGKIHLTSDKNITENMIEETEKSHTLVATNIQKNVSRTGKEPMEYSQGLCALSTKNVSQGEEVENELNVKKIPHSNIPDNIPSEVIKEALVTKRVTPNGVINETSNDQTTNSIGKNRKKLTDETQKPSVTTQESEPSSSGTKQLELRGKRKSVTFASTVHLKNNSRTEEISLASSPPSNSKRKRSRNSNARSLTNQTANSDFEISMTVPLSHISFDDKSNECRTKGHSTPLKDKEHQNEINNVNNKENRPVDDHLFAVPLNKSQAKSFGSSVSDRKRKESTSDESGDNMSKRRKTIDKTIDDLSNDNLLDVSEIPLDKTIAQRKLIYHSTPIAPVVERKARLNGRAKQPRNDCNDKNIQVSKSLFGTSSEATTATSTRKDGLSTSYSYNVSLRRSNRISSIQKSVSVNKSLQSKENSDTSRNNSKTNIDSMSDTSPSKLISTTSTGNIASNEESPTIRTFYSTNNTITTLSRSRTVDSEHSEVSPKRVCFRSFPSHIDSVTNSLSSRSYYSECATRNEEDSGVNSHSGIQPSINNSISFQNDEFSVEPETDINMNKESEYDFSKNVSRNITALTSSEITLYSEVSLPTPTTKLFFRRRSKLSMSKDVHNKDYSIISLRTRKPLCKHNFQLDQNFDIEGKPYIPPKINFGVHVPPSFFDFSKKKLELMYGLESSIVAQRVISNLDATISAVKMLKTADEVKFHTLVLRNILSKYGICKTLIEYYTLVRKYTPFDFQRKVLPLGGKFEGLQKESKYWKLNSPIIAPDELVTTS